MEQKTLLGRFLVWRLKHIKQNHFVLILSLFIGILSGFAAVMLKNTVHFTSNILLRGLEIQNVHYLYIVYPIIGITLTVLFVKYVIRDNLGHGISRILYAISKRNSIIKSHHTYSSMLTSTLTVGFGGSVGLEAPVVLTGSAIGSNLGRLMKLNYKTITLLIGCGAAGAIAGIFKAPITAVIFGLEVLMLNLSMASLVPLLISAVSGAMVAYFFLGRGFIFTFQLVDTFHFSDIPFFILLGIFSGLISAYFSRATNVIESGIGKIKNLVVKLVLAGVSLGLLIFLFPPLYGEGYETLIAILNNQAEELTHGSLFYGMESVPWMFILFLFLILIFKAFASALTSGGGGVGGIFAPTLFMGGVTGYMSAKLFNMLNLVQVSEKNFALVGMAGLMAGVMHAPLTAIFLIAEITGGYQLFIPLIITSTIAYLTIMYFEPHSIYTKRLAQRGELLTHDKDQAILHLIKMKSVIEKDFKKVRAEATLGELVKIISKSKRNIFPVVDSEEMLQGIVLLDNIREVIFEKELYDNTFVSNLMIVPPEIISIHDSMETVMRKFHDSGAWNLPVSDNGRYIGFISKSKLFSIYRKWLVDISLT